MTLGLGRVFLKESKANILENSGFSGVKSHSGAVELKLVRPWSWRVCLMIYRDILSFHKFICIDMLML